MIAIDTSLLCFGVNRFAPEHSRAARVLEDLVNGERPWAIPWPAAHEFLARVTHPHAVARALRPADALGFLDELAGGAALQWLGPTERHAAIAVDVLGLSGHAEAGLPPGFEVAVVLREHGVRELLSSDRAMRRYRFLDVRDPVHGELWVPAERPARRYRTLASGRQRRSPTPTRRPA